MADENLLIREIHRHKDPVTLTRFILHEQSKHKEAQGDMTILLQSVQLACKVIANAFSKAGIAQLYGVAGTDNVSGDHQKKLDVFSNEAFINCMTFSEKICLMVSEENEQVIRVDDSKSGKYAICFDPLDGSSNIDANVAVGTIFGIFKQQNEDEKANLSDVLRPGRELRAAGYAIYGPACMLVLTTGQGVNGFTLDPSLGEFVLTHPEIKIPEEGNIYSINEGNSLYWDEPTRKFVEQCKNPNKGKPKSLRYIGSMVADVHRTLLYGGVFAYPGDKKAPQGKLRLLYEGAPMSFIVNQAGGASTTGTGPVLDVVPESLHQRVGLFLGSKKDIELIEEYYKRFGDKQ